MAVRIPRRRSASFHHPDETEDPVDHPPNERRGFRQTATLNVIEPAPPRRLIRADDVRSRLGHDRIIGGGGCRRNPSIDGQGRRRPSNRSTSGPSARRATPTGRTGAYSGSRVPHASGGPRGLRPGRGPRRRQRTATARRGTHGETTRPYDTGSKGGRRPSRKCFARESSRTGRPHRSGAAPLFPGTPREIGGARCSRSCRSRRRGRELLSSSDSQLSIRNSRPSRGAAEAPARSRTRSMSIAWTSAAPAPLRSTAPYPRPVPASRTRCPGHAPPQTDSERCGTPNGPPMSWNRVPAAR